MKKLDKCFSFGDYKIHDEILNSVPATKEQRDFLFQKMKEAGYEWDAERKELKKIEQKSARWSEEDEKRSISAIKHLENSISDTPSSLRPYIRKDIEWLKSIKNRMKMD